MRAPIPPNPDPSRPVMTGLTWQAFLDLPDEYRHADLVDGELFVSSPTPQHQRIVSRLVIALGTWADAGPGRGEVTIEPAVQIAHDRGYMPDVAWWHEDRCAPPDRPAGFEGPPNLVAEVLSPSTRRLDTVRKRNDYPRIGVAELWFIDPEPPAALLVRTQGDGEQVVEVGPDDDLRSPLLDGFRVRLGDLTRRG